MCDEGASQPSNGWLRKVGVPSFGMFKKGLKLIPKEVRSKVA